MKKFTDVNIELLDGYNGVFKITFEMSDEDGDKHRLVFPRLRFGSPDDIIQDLITDGIESLMAQILICPDDFSTYSLEYEKSNKESKNDAERILKLMEKVYI